MLSAVKLGVNGKAWRLENSPDTWNRLPLKLLKCA
jgi:hypothetical protein